MTVPLREELRGIQPYGAPQLDVPVQLNVNENPYGPSPACIADIATAVAHAASTLRKRTLSVSRRLVIAGGPPWRRPSAAGIRRP